MNGNSISIEILTGLNFKKWKEDFLLGMELADVHIALTKDKPLVHGGIHVWHAMRND